MLTRSIVGNRAKLSRWLRIHVVTILLFSTAVCGILFCVLWQKNTVFSDWINPDLYTTPATTVAPFPVGVNPSTKEIAEQPTVDYFVKTYLSKTETQSISWQTKLTATLAQHSWYQQLASPLSRILVILPGERKEEVANNFAQILNWSIDEKNTFINLVTSTHPALPEGSFFPGQYVATKDSTPEEIASLVNNKFKHQIYNRYTEAEKTIPLKDAIIIASLLEREAHDFTDMRYISGVIWNRLFIDMPLQLDATLQYANANLPTTRSWWPKVVPDDKYIDSPFNTYQNNSLPPAPIANVSVASVIAALNPRQTDCLFYFHDENATFYCSETYEEHVSKLKALYGQGR